MLYKEIGRNILIIDKYFKLYLKTSLKYHGLNTAEGMVLLTLYEQTGQTSAQVLQNIHHKNFATTQNQLIDDLHYDKGVMTRTIQSLEQKGFVQRADNPMDSRSFLLNVTDQAVEFKPVVGRSAIQVKQRRHRIISSSLFAITLLGNSGSASKARAI